MIGAEAPTERVTLAVLDPAEFVAVIVYEVAERVEVGVPEITQVELFIEAQAGRAGEAAQVVTDAPLIFKVEGATLIKLPTLPLVPVLAEKLMIGADAPTDKLTLAVLDPAEFVAVIV